MKFKALAAAAVVMSSATVANAAWRDGWEGIGDYDGELVLVAFDEVRQVSVVQDLGGSAIEFVNNINNTSFSKNYALDPLFASTFAGSNLADIRWSVYANANDLLTGDVNSVLITTNEPAPFYTIDDYFAHQNKTVLFDLNFNGWMPSGPSRNYALNTSFYGDVANGRYAGGDDVYGRNLGYTAPLFDVTAAATESLYFWALQADVVETFETQSVKFPGFWTLDIANGSLSYSAVPVPAAIWLLASGLLGLGAISRRRKA